MRFLDRLKDKHWNTKAKYILLIDDIFHEEEEFHLTGSEYTLEEAKQVLKDTRTLLKHLKKKTVEYYSAAVNIVYLLILVPLLVKFNFIYWGTWFKNTTTNDGRFGMCLLYILVALAEILSFAPVGEFKRIPKKLYEKNQKEISRLKNIEAEILKHYKV